MRFMKKAAITILAMVSMLCLICGAVACGGNGMSAKEVIERYLLPQDQTLVDADFTLPKTLGSAESPVEVKWTSNNPAAITIEDKGESYNAKVTIQDEVTDVTLTVSAGSASKNFTVRVDGFSVYTFLDNYNFPQRKTSVKEDFDLDTEMTFQGKKATISWAIDDKYSTWIKLNGNKVLVTPGEDIVDVEIEATFTYKTDTATQKYPFSVVPLLEHLQTVNRYYSVTDYPLELSGYIVHVYEASESYGNATFYMIDDDFCSGYYCYRVKIDTADVAKFVEGAHVTVSGDTTKNYNGLWENNSGGKAVVDDTAKINPREKVYAMDTDLLAGVPSLLWHESTFVSLSGWKVASKPDTKPTAADTNLFTLEKDGTKITVRITKYMQRTDAELAALCDVYDSVNVGDFVNVTGILGNYNAFQIQPVVASDITKVDVEGTNTDGAKVKAAVKAVDDAVKANFSGLITSDTEIKMPISAEGVTISYRVAGASNPTVTIEKDGTFKVSPVVSEKNYDIEVTYSIGSYKGYGFFKIRNIRASAAQLLAMAKANVEAIELAEVKAAGTVTIPEVDLYGAKITWAVKDAPDWITVSGNTLTISALPAAATTLTLTATITLGSESETAKISLAVAEAPALTFKALDAPAAGNYLFSAMHKGERLYASSLELDGNYIATTNDVTKAVELTIEKSGDNWLLKMGTKYLEVNPYKGKSGTSYSLRLVDTATEGAVWVWDNDIKIFKQKPITTDAENAPAADAYFYIGMRDNADFTTMSPSDIKYVTGDNAANLDVTQHPSRFGTMVPGSGTTEPEPGPGGDEEHDDATYGSEAKPLSVTEALALATKECVNSNDFTAQLVYMIGIVKANPTDNKTYYQNLYLLDVTNPATEILVYSINLGEGVAAPAQHDTVVICGYIKNYNGTIEFASNNGTYVYLVKNTRGESAISTQADGATVSGLPTGDKATNGTEITFQVAPVAGKQLASVKVYDETLEAAADGSYKFTLKGDATIVVETVDEGAALPEEVAKLGFAAGEHDNDGQTNQYTETWEATRDNVTWTITSFSNNKGAWNLIKTGNKSREVTGTITTKAALTDAISRIVVKIDSTSKSYMADKVKSFKLQIAGSADFTDATEVTATIQVGENVFDISAPAANKFYRIVIDCDAGSDNGFVVLTEVSYWINTQSSEPEASVTFSQQQQGTFKCSMMMGDDGPDPDLDVSNVPDLVVSEHSITWGDKVITNLQANGDDPNSFTFQIGSDNYGLNFTGGWMLVKLDAEGEMVEGYMFGDMGGGVM